MLEDLDPLISVSAAARQIGLTQSTLAKQVRAGLVRSHGGKVRLSEVLADRAANIDLGRSKRNQGAVDDYGPAAPSPATAPAPRRNPTSAEPGPEPGSDAEDDERVVMVDGQPMSLGEAKALKESYHAWRAKIAWEVDRNAVAYLSEVTAHEEHVIMVLRERLLSLPGECSDRLSQDQVEYVRDKLFEAMEELSALGTQAERSIPRRRGESEGDAAPNEATAAAEPRRVGRGIPTHRAEDQRFRR